MQLLQVLLHLGSLSHNLTLITTLMLSRSIRLNHHVATGARVYMPDFRSVVCTQAEDCDPRRHTISIY